VKCAQFEDFLDRFLENSLIDEERLRVKQHLQECERCSDLAAIVQGDLNLLESAVGDVLTRSVLKRTSGSACGKDKNQLPDYEDGRLGAEIAARMKQHLDHCQHCAAVLAVLKELDTVLPILAIVEPDVGFTAEVLSRTSGWQPAPRTPQPSWGARLGDWWDWCLARPRFSWEAAYVGTLIFVLVFGVSGLSVENVVARPLSTVESKLAPGIEATSDIVLSRWQKTEEETDRLARGLRGEWVAGRKTAVESLKWLQGKAEELRAALSLTAVKIGSQIQSVLDGPDSDDDAGQETPESTT